MTEKQYNWYNVFGAHKTYGAIDEELYIGDIIGENSTIAKARAKRKYPRWNIMRVVLLKEASRQEYNMHRDR